MNTGLVETIVRTLLYEGYMLYPYRPSALKNRKRWYSGIVYPHDYSIAERGAEPWTMQTQCIAMTGVPMAAVSTSVRITIRFLQLAETSNASMSWQETVERQIEQPILKLSNSPLADKTTFSFPGIQGAVEVTSCRVAPSVIRLGVRILNETPLASISASSREVVLMNSMLSVHTILQIDGGEFVSLTDPPEHLREHVSQCVNSGAWPVLVGELGDRDCLLSSSVILSDYPQVAPETAGDFFDCTEIDEMLNLRIQTLTDEEKDEARSADPRAGEILERASSLPAGHLQKLHGALRGFNTSLPVNSSVAAGSRVRLRPRAGGDIFDIVLAGRLATVDAVEEDFEGRIHIAVVIDDDPGRDLGQLRQPGHRFFFSPDEVEVIA
jgi:hypothetical protein